MANPTDGVYAIRNEITGCVYIGASVHCERRWIDHRRLLERGAHPIPNLQLDWNWFGSDAFAWVVLELVPNWRCREPIEQRWINHFLAGKGVYNRNLRVWSPISSPLRWDPASKTEDEAA